MSRALENELSPPKFCQSPRETRGNCSPLGRNARMKSVDSGP